MIKIILMVMWIVLLFGCTSSTHPYLKTIEHLEMDRYTGKWVEIARYENRFEKGCAGATANYTFKDGRIDVLNQCFDDKGILSAQAHGKAHATDSSNSKLKVSFFWPFYGDYQVIMLADDYRYSVVGEPSRKYLWILSRTGELPESDKAFILSQLPGFGYDPIKLFWTSIRP